MDTNRLSTFADRRFRIHLILTMVGAIGIPAIFLQFAWSTSPLGAAFEKDLWRLAWPFFLPALVTAAMARWLISGRLSLPERAIAYLVSVAMFCMTLSLYASLTGWPPDLRTWIGLALPIVTLVFGTFTLLRARRNAMLSPMSAVLSMQLAYLANCLLCLSSFWGQWEIGAYCVLVTAIAYLIQIGLAWRPGEESDSFSRKNDAQSIG